MLQPLTEELRSVRKIEWAVVIRSSPKLFSVGMLLTFLVGCLCGCLGSPVSCPLNTKSTLLVTVKTGSVPYTFPDVVPGEVLPAAESHSSCRNFPHPQRTRFLALLILVMWACLCLYFYHKHKVL